jgi:predicted outer membrane repeat protein
MASANINAITHTVTSNASSGIGTLRQLVNDAASGDTIMFNTAITSIILSSQIRIEKDITIIGGSGNTILSGGNSSKIFIFNGEFEVTIKNINFTRGNVVISGGAIEVNNSIFNGSTLTLENCNFSQNYATVGGAAIYIVVQRFTSVIAINCNFTNNSCSYHGGAVCAHDVNSFFTAINCSFRNNTAPEGGALYLGSAVNNGPPSTLIDCVFENNTATEGGAIYIFGRSTLDISNSRIGFNSAVRGGGLYIGSGDNVVYDNDNVWYENHATEAGGAYYSEP